MEAKKGAILLALFYPFALVTVAAGFLAFLMMMFKLDLLFVSTVALWFYFVGAASIYLISKKALEAFGLRRFFLGFLSTMGTFAVLSAILLVSAQA